jgi:hypothetical protein
VRKVPAQKETGLAMVAIADFNVEELRARLAKMSESKLERFGRAARYMSDPKYGPVEPTYALQLKEARREWRRRQKNKTAPNPRIISYPVL